MKLSSNINQLAGFVRKHPKLFVLTGAGVSTDSGIPDYRDESGDWKGRKPIQGPDFVKHEHVRKKYWARSLIGWQHFGNATPNASHHALAELEKRGYVAHLVTQNVDGLHQQAGSSRVTNLHGRLDRVICLNCGERMTRAKLQQRLEAQNPIFIQMEAGLAPDGDALLEHVDFSRMQLVGCDQCDGVLKPDVVFYGENVPADRVRRCMERLHAADALLVVGSSLMVYSGFRFCREAERLGLPIYAVNLGRTRADDMLSLKIKVRCAKALPLLLQQLA